MLAVMRSCIQSFPGVAAPVGGHERAAPLFCITGTAALFRASGPAATAPLGVHISRGVATVPLDGCAANHRLLPKGAYARCAAGCRNGEVWSSPCRESPRGPPRSQRGRASSAAKAEGGLQMMLEECGPGRGGPYPGSRHGAHRGAGLPEAVRWSRLRAAADGGARNQGPHHTSRTPTRQLPEATATETVLFSGQIYRRRSRR